MLHSLSSAKRHATSLMHMSHVETGRKLKKECGRRKKEWKEKRTIVGRGFEARFSVAAITFGRSGAPLLFYIGDASVNAATASPGAFRER